ncbi:MAG: T9SS type A sorting domain-containing protein [Flavobacteriales bacterium]|nr:T9SS type A sorting domain-containing protein [Flavobacteriales bacterium]
MGAINLIYFDANNVGNQSIDDGRLISGDSTNCVTSIIDEIGFRQAKVFPNTMSGILNFENFNDKVVEIYSNQRRLVRIENVENRQLDLRELKSGMYYIKEWRLF